MKALITLLLVSQLAASGFTLAGEQPPGGVDAEIAVACNYFGNYHPGDPRNVATKGKDWSEWELVKAAMLRFPGHQQPKVPLWGYGDESDPKVMAQKIDAAADHGIDAFIFDWYYYNDGPFLDRPIDVGFLQAPNNDRIKFAFMWANCDWLELHPYRRGTPQKLLYPGAYYMFATFTGRAGGRGSQILRAESPEGPFVVHGDQANTPAEQTALDATPFIDPDGTHWMVYAHEWTQIKGGTFLAVKMESDWSAHRRADLDVLRLARAVGPPPSPRRHLCHRRSGFPSDEKRQAGHDLVEFRQGSRLRHGSGDLLVLDGSWVPKAK